MKVQVSYFTDPLCAWSYASEPTVQAVINEFGRKVDIQFKSLPILDRTVGKASSEEIKIHTPDEMFQEWSEISKKTGVAIDAGLWRESPPHSSWPANRAMKAAFRQGFDKGNGFVHDLREAIMKDKLNPSNLDALKMVAEQTGLDVDQFYTDMTANAFELEQEVANDKLVAMQQCVSETPTLVMQNDNGDKVIVAGTLDYEVVNRSLVFLSGEKVIGSQSVEIAPFI